MGQLCPIKCTFFSSECEKISLQCSFKLIGAVTTAENWYLNNDSLLVREKSSGALAVPFIGRCQSTSLYGIMS